MQIVADKKSYAPGDTAHISIISEVEGFHALVVASGYTVEFQKVVSSDGRTLTFDLPITRDSQPNLEVSVVFLKDDKLYQATKQIKVPPVQEQLQIEIAPVKPVFQPQQKAEYDVYTRDYTGQAGKCRLQLRCSGRSYLLNSSGYEWRHSEETISRPLRVRANRFVAGVLLQRRGWS